MAFTIFYCNLLLFSSLSFILPSELSFVSRGSSYIIHTDQQAWPPQFSNQDDWYASLITSLADEDDDERKFLYGTCILYTYDEVFHGFAASLTNQEAKKFTNMPGVVGLYRDRVRFNLQTTRSPGFLGLNENYGLWPDTNFGENIIIGLVDSGIWPESESFRDSGLGPVPSKWKGGCEEGAEFNSSNCNRKLIGARYFLKGIQNYYMSSGGSMEKLVDYMSPRDGIGHGTHTASTAAGAEVKNVDIFCFARGTARGVATKARIAMYKACASECAESDVLAAMESAIKDGVDILSLSIGFQDPPYYEHVLARGAFAAVKKNIFVCCSAGNVGPYAFSVHNTAPWITTVGAGSIDRTFPVEIQLGDGRLLVGSSLYPGKINGSSYPLVFLRNCYSIKTSTLADDIKGKIVVCNSSKSYAVKRGLLIQAAGGAGLIQLNYPREGEGLMAMTYPLPAATLGYREAMEIVSYINSSKNPTAAFKMHNLTLVGKDQAPFVLGFSARGPNAVVPEILKPDIIAPGLNILAAWPPVISPSRAQEDRRRVNYNMDTGTSMACPHIAGVAALIRAAHPDWSPAAIRSAFMTTSSTIDNHYFPVARYENLEPATPISIGAGHVNPQMASDPGLVYDASVADYVTFLCGLNYTDKQMKAFGEGKDSCSGLSSSPGDLNYPSFSAVFKPNGDHVRKLNRTVTAVGMATPEVYRVRVVNAGKVKVSVRVSPRSLAFKKSYGKQSYSVIFKNTYTVDNKRTIVEQMVFGFILWESDRHVVRSPFAVMWDKPKH
ncbi:Tripeptidyl-peptidase II [Bertholletia excelsa]